MTKKSKKRKVSLIQIGREAYFAGQASSCSYIGPDAADVAAKKMKSLLRKYGWLK